MGGELNVLLLDDEMSIHILVKDYLKDVYNVYSAYNIAEAKDLLHTYGNNFFQIYLVDMHLESEFDGIEFAYEYLEDCKTIIISGYMTDVIRDKLVNMGIFAVFSKPFNLTELFITMNSVIRCGK